MIIKRKKTNTGYSLIEVVFYVALFTVLSIVLLNFLITMTSFFMKTMVNRDIMQGAIVMENISRELKQANNFTFLSNSLTVNTKDISNNPKTIIYTLSNSNIQLTDSVYGNLGNLNTPNVSIDSFNVSLITTLKGKAAKINLTVKSNRDEENIQENFVDTVILRGSY